MSVGSAPRPLGSLAPQPGNDWTGAGIVGDAGIVSEELRAQIAEYLSACPIFLAWMEHTRDVIGERFGVDGGSAIASDGVFYWRVDAAAYIREYGVAIPDDALTHMRERNWTPPEFTRDEYLGLYQVLMTMLESDVDT